MKPFCEIAGCIHLAHILVCHEKQMTKGPTVCLCKEHKEVRVEWVKRGELFYPKLNNAPETPQPTARDAGEIE